MPLAITNYEISVFIRVTAVMVGFGATFAESVMFPVAMKMSIRNLPYVHRLQLTLNQFFALPALVVVVGTGIYQMSEGQWQYGHFWVTAALVIVAVIALNLIAFFIPTDRKLLPIIEKAIADAGGKELTLADLPKDYQRLGRLESVMGTFTGLLLIAAVFMMTTKPGL